MSDNIKATHDVSPTLKVLRSDPYTHWEHQDRAIS